MSDIIISKKNEVYLKLNCEPHILYELAPYFVFEVENAKFMPQSRRKNWDGTIRLLSTHTGELYVGLLDKLIEKIKSHEYTYEFEDSKFYGLPFEENELISFAGVKSYMKSILSSKYEARDYQIDAVTDALKFNRKLLLSPTSSGKSMMIYSLIRYYTQKGFRTLLITPTTSLVEQMYKDFHDYGWDCEEFIHRVYSGRAKQTDKPIMISTYQSIYDLDKRYFNDFDVVIVDECFSGHMRVLTPNGYTKIMDLKIGDKIINYDEKDNLFKEDEVAKVHKNLSISDGEKMYKLEFDNGSVIEVTGNHKFLTDCGWIRADELNEVHNIINIS